MITLGGYDIHELLGKGAFGRVYRASKDQQNFAIKLINLTSKSLRMIKHEAEVGIHVSGSSPEVVRKCGFDLSNHGRTHPYIACTYDAGAVQLTTDFDTFKQGDKLAYIITEYVPGPNLTKYIKFLRLHNLTMTSRQLWRYMLQLVAAVYHTHNLGLANRDVKPANILKTDVDMRTDTLDDLKMIDWGLVCNKYNCNSYSGTPRYLPPEIVTNRSRQHRLIGLKYSLGHDVWSLGVTCYQMANLTYPHDFETLTHQDKYKHLERPDKIKHIIKHHQPKRSQFNSTTDEFYVPDYIINHIIDWMLTFDFNSRPTIFEVYDYMMAEERGYIINDVMYHRADIIKLYNQHNIRVVDAYINLADLGHFIQHHM